jgi:hypothetical protein
MTGRRLKGTLSHLLLKPLKPDSHIACRAHAFPLPCRAYAVPLPCRAIKGLECVFPI